MRFFLSFALMFVILAVRAAPTAPSTEASALAPRTNSSNAARQTYDFSGVSCATECYSGGAGTGPNEYDCTQIIVEFWSLGEWKFTTPADATNYYPGGSCLLTFQNPSSHAVTYQDNLMGSVADYIRTNCNAAHNAHGGKCTFSTNLNPPPYIELLHS